MTDVAAMQPWHVLPPPPSGCPQLGVCGHIAVFNAHGTPAGTMECVVERHLGEGQILVRTTHDNAFAIPAAKFVADASLLRENVMRSIDIARARASGVTPPPAPRSKPRAAPRP